MRIEKPARVPSRTTRVAPRGVACVVLAGWVLACSDTPSVDSIPADAQGFLDGAGPDAPTADAAADAGPSDAPPDVSANDASADATAKPVSRVLFIGNSYTAVNDLPGVLRELGKSAQSPVTFEVAQHTPGGTSWETHDADPAVEQLIQQGWDTVVLQDQSAQPWFAKGIKPALVSLDAKIESTGAETVLYMTWGRVQDPNIYPPNYAMEMAVNNYYERHAGTVGARVAPVGRAWERALRDPAQSLHAPDGSHPNERGTYLAACVFYTTLTEQSPIGLGDGGLGLPESDRTTLQHVAWETHVSRQRLPSPAIGSWPLSAGALSQDFVPTQALAIRGVSRPGGGLPSGTQFGPNQYGAIPYFAGINPPKLTVVLHAYRADWSVWTTSPEGLVNKTWAYG